MEPADQATDRPAAGRQLPGKPSRRPRRERKPWSRRRKRLLAGALGAALGLLLAYWWLLFSLGGDYVFDARFPRPGPIRFSALPFPIASQRGAGKGTAIYLVQPGGRIGAYWLDGGGVIATTLDPIPGGGGEAYVGVYEHSPDVGYFTAERFPRGSVDELFATIRARDYRGFAREASALQLSLPDRVTAKYWAAAGLFAADRGVEGRQALERWRADFQADPTWRGEWCLRLLESDALATSPAEEKLRKEAVLALGGSSAQASASGLDYGQLMDWVASRSGQPSYRTRSLRGDDVGDWLSPLPALRLASVEASLQMLLGERERAVDLLLGSWSIAGGQENRFAGSAIDFAIAAANEFVVASLLSDLFLRGSWSAEEWCRLQPRLEAALTRRPADAIDDVRDIFDPARRHRRPEAEAIGCLEFWMRSVHTQSKVELLREGARAAAHRAAEGEWPAIGENDELIGLSLPLARPLADPAAPGRGVRAALEPDGLLLWCVGPDGVDQRGGLAYDPTNGTTSAGDLVLLLKNEPTWDFPEDAGHVYADIDEWNRRYPSGLPLDPFANGGQLKLSRDGTARVWSFGPDHDAFGQAANERTLAPGEEVEPRYDPRTGSNGDGDLWVVVPFERTPAPADGVDAQP